MRAVFLYLSIPLLFCLALGAPGAPERYPGSDSDLRCELAVIGGGSGGFGAALAAARLGVDVVLVEMSDQLGGNSVRGGVHCWEPGVGGTGIPFDLYRRLARKANAVGIYNFGRHLGTFDPQRESYPYPGGETVIDPSRHYLDSLLRHGTRGLSATTALAFRREKLHGVVFEPGAMAEAMQSLLAETGHCRVLLKAAFVSAKAEGGRIQSINLSGGRTLTARYYVDATGDGLVCTAAGCQILKGQESRATYHEPDAPATATARVNGASLVYRVTPVAEARLEPLPEGIAPRCWWAKNFPVAQINHYPNGDLNVNMLPTMEGAEFLKRGYADTLSECRRRVLAHWHHVQTTCAEFQKYRLNWIAPALGIRESQRILGEAILTENDLLAGLSNQKAPDIIGIADHPMDTHGSQARGIGEMREPYGIPYRCLVPKGQRNLLIACRAASFSSLAASSCRLSRTMIQLGQAAGTAVALAKSLDVALPAVPADRLRAALRRQHVQLESPMPADLRAYLSHEEAD